MTACLFPIGFALQNSYRTIPIGYIPMNQTTSVGKNPIGSKSYTIPTLFLWIKGALNINITGEKRTSVRTYRNFTVIVTEKPSIIFVLIPMWTHRHMIPDYVVAFSGKLCSDESWLRHSLPFWNDDWEFATQRSGHPFGSFFHVVSPSNEIIFFGV